MRNGWGGRLCNVGGAYLFFLHSLMGKKKKKICRGHGPPSHYVAPPLKFKNMGNHIVLFIFDKLEVETILENEPWSFDKHLMVLQRYDKDTSVEEL